MPFKTADLCDEFWPNSENELEPKGEDIPKIQVTGNRFKSYGGRPRFYGEVVTLKIFEDNQLVRDQVSSDGTGKVLVIDGGASMRRALLGDMLAAKAVKNGWNGVIINGCIRDSVDMATMNLGVFALGTVPIKTVKNGVGQTNVQINFENLTIHAGDYIYADEDGIIVSGEALI